MRYLHRTALEEHVWGHRGEPKFNLVFAKAFSAQLDGIGHQLFHRSTLHRVALGIAGEIAQRADDLVDAISNALNTLSGVTNVGRF